MNSCRFVDCPRKRIEIEDAYDYQFRRATLLVHILSLELSTVNVWDCLDTVEVCKGGFEKFRRQFQQLKDCFLEMSRFPGGQLEPAVVDRVDTP